MATYTYDLANIATTPLVQIRRMIGDTGTTAATCHFADEEITYEYGVQGNDTTETAIELLEQLATMFADKASVSTGGQRIDLSGVSQRYADRAQSLRERAGDDGGIGDMATTRVDGYSDDVAADDVDPAGPGHTRDRPYYGNKL